MVADCSEWYVKIMNILYFDGVCGLCNGFVDFILRLSMQNNVQPRFYLSPLQSEKAKNHIPSQYISKMDSLIYFKNGKFYTYSDAVIEVLYDVSKIFFWIKIAYLVPGKIRNKIYLWVSRHRYAWFGKKEICRIPSQKEKEFFILD